jgi:Right handed beta helix region
MYDVFRRAVLASAMWVSIMCWPLTAQAFLWFGDPWFDVRSYTAIPDDGLDDTAAMQAVLNAVPAQGAMVRIPPGVWNVSASLKPKSNTHIVLELGATLKAANINWLDTGVFDLRNVQNVHLSGAGVIDGDKAHNPSGRIFGLVLYNAVKVTIRSLTIQNMPGLDASGGNGGDGIYVSGTIGTPGSQDVLISGVKLSGNVRQGISLVIARGITVEDSVIENTTGSNPGCGIDLEPNNGTDLVKDVLIRGNRFRDNNCHVITGSGTPDVAWNVTISDNHMSDHRTWGAIRLSRRGALVSGNTIHFTKSNGIMLQHANDTIVMGNTIEATYAVDERSGILVVDSCGFILQGNLIKHTYGQGILVDQRYNSAAGLSCDGLIADNVLLDTVLAGRPNLAPLTVQSSAPMEARRLSIKNNLISDTRPGTDAADWGITMNISGPELCSMDIAGNTVRGIAVEYNGQICQ